MAKMSGARKETVAGGPEPTSVLEIKSQFELEFRRISIPRSGAERLSLDSLYRLLTDAHCLPRGAPVLVRYQHPRDMRQAPLETQEELEAALSTAAPLLRLFVSRVRGLEVEVSEGEEEEGDGGEKERGEGGGGGKEKRVEGRGEREEGGKRGRQRGRDGGAANLFYKAVNSLIPPSSSEIDRHTTSPHRGSPGKRGGGATGEGATHEESNEHPLLGCYGERGRCEEGRVWDEVGESGTEERAVVNGLNRLSLSDDGQQEFPYVIEIYGFSPSLSTRDLLQEFVSYSRSELTIKWVDDTHALGIFACERQAWLAAGAVFKRFRTRLLRDGTQQSIAVAERFAVDLRPAMVEGEGRPKTTAMVARRMVSSALGIRVALSNEQREREQRELQAARENKTHKKLDTKEL